MRSAMVRGAEPFELADLPDETKNTNPFADKNLMLVAERLLQELNPVLLLITLPVNVLTLGLFTLVINGALFLLVGRVVRGFYVADFWAGFWGAIVVSLVSFFVGGVMRRGAQEM